MSRGLWFLAGTAAGVYTSVRARRAAESMTVEGLQDRLQGLAAGARVLRDEVAAGRAEKETDVRARLSLVSDESTESAESTSGETPEITTGKVDD